MTKEELLKPRYKVKAPWPEMRARFKGDPIIVLDSQDKDGYYTTNGHYQESFFKMYPHLFKPLEWWEEREEKDMPEYLKLEFNNKIHFVHKVERWSGENSYGAPLYEYINKVGYKTTSCVSDLLPATEKEYLN